MVCPVYCIPEKSREMWIMKLYRSRLHVGLYIPLESRNFKPSCSTTSGEILGAGARGTAIAGMNTNSWCPRWYGAIHQGINSNGKFEL
jgi:hypothetical protein